MTGEEIRRQLENLESQTIDLAGQLIGAIAEIRSRLVLMETVVDMKAAVEARDQRDAAR